jgi:thioredoxin 1
VYRFGTFHSYSIPSIGNKTRSNNRNSSTMALCCIGGVCIPYTALLPLLVLGLQWILKMLAQAGLLPSSWTSTLHRYLQHSASSTKKKKNDSSSSSSTCCDTNNAGDNRNRLRRGKQSKVSDVTAATACCASNDNNNTKNKDVVVHCTTEDEWENLVRTTTASAMVVKFTATWCQPCQKIQPVFAALCAAAASSTSSTNDDDDDGILVGRKEVQWATVDVDGCDGLASNLQVLSLPTFLLLDRQTQTVIGTSYSGSDETKLREWWKAASELAKKMS